MSHIRPCHESQGRIGQEPSGISAPFYIPENRTDSILDATGLLPPQGLGFRASCSLYKIQGITLSSRGIIDLTGAVPNAWPPGHRQPCTAQCGSYGHAKSCKGQSAEEDQLILQAHGVKKRCPSVFVTDFWPSIQQPLYCLQVPIKGSRPRL